MSLQDILTTLENRRRVLAIKMTNLVSDSDISMNLKDIVDKFDDAFSFRIGYVGNDGMIHVLDYENDTDTVPEDTGNSLFPFHVHTFDMSSVEIPEVEPDPEEPDNPDEPDEPDEPDNPDEPDEPEVNTPIETNLVFKSLCPTGVEKGTLVGYRGTFPTGSQNGVSYVTLNGEQNAAFKTDNEVIMQTMYFNIRLHATAWDYEYEIAKINNLFIFNPEPENGEHIIGNSSGLLYWQESTLTGGGFYLGSYPRLSCQVERDVWYNIAIVEDKIYVDGVLMATKSREIQLDSIFSFGSENFFDSIPLSAKEVFCDVCCLYGYSDLHSASTIAKNAAAILSGLK